MDAIDALQIKRCVTVCSRRMRTTRNKMRLAMQAAMSIDKNERGTMMGYAVRQRDRFAIVDVALGIECTIELGC